MQPLPTRSPLHRYRDWWAAVALAGVAVAVFARVLYYGFITLDDPYYVFLNPYVQSGLNANSIGWAFTTFDNSNWHPLTWLSLELDTTVWGRDPWGYHLTNVLLHAGNAALLFLTLRALTGAFWRSAAVALLFAVHPLRVESVAWVTERKDVLSIFFGLLALWSYARYVAAPSAGRYVLIALALALSLLAKSMLVTLPFLLLVLDWWPLGRVHAGSRWTRLVVEKLPLFALVAASAVMTYYVQSTQGAVRGLTKFPMAVRIENVAVSYVEYLSKTFWPTGLAVFYPHAGANLPAWKVIGATLLLAAVTVAAVALARRAPYLLAGWLWYLGTLVPVIGLVQVGNQAYADRYTYFPQIGILVALCWGVAELSVRHARVALATAAAAAVALAFLTDRQLEVWRDSVTLWNHTIQAGGRSATALESLARALEDVGGSEALAKALRYYQEAEELDPDSVLGQTNLGRLLSQMGRQEEAIMHLRRACELDPDDAVAHTSLGDAYFQQKKLDDSAREQEAALRITTTAYPAHYGLGRIEFERGNLGGAIDHYWEALRLRPDFPEGHYSLAKALLARGNKEEAVAHLQMAVKGNPRIGDAQFLLGRELLAAGQTGPGVAHLAQAVQCGPMPREAYFLLGRELARHGEFAQAEPPLAEAVRLDENAADAWYWLGKTRVHLSYIDAGQDCLEKALKLNPGVAAYKFELARVLDARASAAAKDGNLTEATDLANRAFELAKDANNPELVRLIEQQLDGFRRGRVDRPAPRTAP